MTRTGSPAPVAKAPDTGIFHLDGAATEVFQNFDALARTTSLDMYKSVVGPGITQDQLYEVTELVQTQTAAQEGDEAAGRFFLGAVNVFQQLPMPQEYPGTPEDLSAAKRTLVQARKDHEATRADALAANGRADEVRRRLYLAELAMVYFKTGFKVKPADFQLKAAHAPRRRVRRDQAEAELRQLDGVCEPFASAAVRRLIQALALLEAEPVAGRVPDGGDRRQEARASTDARPISAPT